MIHLWKKKNIKEENISPPPVTEQWKATYRNDLLILNKCFTYWRWWWCLHWGVSGSFLSKQMFGFGKMWPCVLLYHLSPLPTDDHTHHRLQAPVQQCLVPLSTREVLVSVQCLSVCLSFSFFFFFFFFAGLPKAHWPRSSMKRIH